MGRDAGAARARRGRRARRLPLRAEDGQLGDAWNPNGATNHIAGVRNEAGNVVGLMPHPEHAVDPDVGPTGGQGLFASLFEAALAGVGA